MLGLQGEGDRVMSSIMKRETFEDCDEAKYMYAVVDHFFLY